ncbi:DoxX family protein [Actinomadura sp. 9N407]|uniref:DoxX family protein n=1 Tax=Actinomadura sp. 9N407 TaxID=3375154 RepID=UPI003797F18B
MPDRVWPRRLLTAFYWIVAFTFIMGCITKFWPGPTFFGPAYSVKFAEWGYPSWFRFIVGSIEGVCAVLLVLPRKRFKFIGAAALMLLLTAATTTHIVAASELQERIAAPTNLGIMVFFVLLNWPADWGELLRP